MAIPRDTLRETVRELLPVAREFLIGSIACPSTHGTEREALALARRAWEGAGFGVEEHPIPEGIRDDPEYSHPQAECDPSGRHNLVVRVGGGTGRSTIINSHLDVVPAEGWPEAFQPQVEGDVVRGRGACDCKGCVAAMFLSALAMRELGFTPPGEVVYQMVIEEEVGGNGSLALIREGLCADGAVVVEPTGLMMHPANRGAVWFRFEFEGRSCHMGRKHEGVNAIDLACETIGILYEYEKELIRDQQDQPLFADYEFPAQVNVGILRGGHYPSAVAGHAEMEGGVGFLPNRSMRQVKDDIARYIERLGSDELKARHSVRYPKLHNDSYETPADHPFVQAFHEATLLTDADDRITGWNVSCDARLFSRLGGMPTVVFGPGRIEHAHSSEERICLGEMATAAETLVRFVEIWCG